MKFRERMGIVEPRSVIQTDSLDDDTRLLVWNTIYRITEHVESRREYRQTDRIDLMASYLWRNEFRGAADEYPGKAKVLQLAKQRILSDDWSAALELY